MKPLFPDVIVNGETITSADISAEAQNHNAPADKPGYAWRAAARALAVRSLLLQEARRRGLKPDPQVLPGDLMETDDEALIRALTDQAIEPQEVTNAACQEVFDRMPEKFRAPDLFEPAHILFKADPKNPEARKSARQTAEKVLASLAKNPKSFAALAKDHSDCSSKDNGGSLGQISAGDTVAEFEAALGGMAEGELLSEPVETRFGFHIIRLDAKASGEQLPFEAVQSRILAQLERLAWAKAANELTSQLVASAEISGIEMSGPAEVAA